MRLRVRHLCLALIPLAALFAFAVRDEVDCRYCTNCGLLRLSEFRTCFGLAWPTTTRYRETEFHRSLLSTGHIECSHRWQAFYENHHHTRPGAIHIPIVLTDNWPYAHLLRVVARLRDPEKRFAILTSFDLTQVMEEHLAETALAFREFRSVPDAVREQDWWMKYRHKFVGRLPPNEAIQRTRLAAGR